MAPSSQDQESPEKPERFSIAIAGTIVDKAATICAPSKANCPATHDYVVRFFEDPADRTAATHETLDNDDGRL